jgi:DNA-binding NarL/FixJ family response regulator
MSSTMTQLESNQTQPQKKKNRAVSIIIADEQPITRYGISTLLGAENGYDIVGQTEDGIESLKLVKELNPHILILDLLLKGISGIEVARQVSRLKLNTKVIVFTEYKSGHYILDAMRAGAMAYVLKEFDTNELMLAINQVMNGHHYLSGPLADFVVDIYANKGNMASDSYDTLTPREREILQLVGLGNTNNEIASRLTISRRTVEVHRTNITKKLGLRTPHIDLAKYVIERDLVNSSNSPMRY